jgi:MerR family transcriptional regulator/heat shock protein HspR
MDATPKYMIGVAAALVGMHPQTLRLYEARGLVSPRRTPGGTRLYSDRDLARLKAIQRLSGDLGLSLAGVEHVMALEDTIQALRDQVATQALSEAHASYRREVVVWSPPSQAIAVRDSSHSPTR